MKRILVALDYDLSAQKVAETGYAFGKSMNAEVTLIHVLAETLYYMPLEYSPVMGFTGFSDAGLIEPIDLDELKRNAQLFLDASKEHLGDSNIKTMIAEGNFAEAILKTAVDTGADIIVAGSHSRGGLEKLLMGSITEKLIHDTTIPLLIVPTKKTKEPS